MRFLSKRKFLRLLVWMDRFMVMPLYDISLLDIFRIYIKGIVEGGLTSRAAAVSYNFFMAFFPAVIFLISLIAYVPISGFQEYLFTLIEQLLPEDLFRVAAQTIEDILKIKRGGLLSSGGILTLIFSANGVNSIITGITHSYHKIEVRSIVNQYLISLFLALAFCFVVILGIALFIGSELLLDQLLPLVGDFSTYLPTLFLIAKFLLFFSLIFLMISLLFYFSTKRSKEWKFFSVGALFTSLLTLFVSYAFGIYVSEFSQYDKLYGSIGSLLLLLLLIYLNALVILFGFEIDISFYTLKKRDRKLLNT